MSLALAERIARAAHATQIEKLTGDPYVLHLARVVALVEGDDAKTVAWLHDTLEDTAETAESLRATGIPAHIVRAVERLTKVKGAPYADHIRDILASSDPLAIAVKRADLIDHLRPMDPPVLTEARRMKYERALAMLTRLDN